MSLQHSSLRLARAAHRPNGDLCSCFASLSINHPRLWSSTASNRATPTLHPTTRRDAPTQSGPSNKDVGVGRTRAEPSYKDMTPVQRAQRIADRARASMEAQVQKQAGSQRLGGLADNSIFNEGEETRTVTEEKVAQTSGLSLAERSISQMAPALNPRPDARARWQRKMVIRHVQRRGRLPREVQILRTERSHLCKSHFFKTSMKKLAPLARQISGKTIEEAILQMRFSKKKAARDVRKHLIQARDEAIVIKGMGLSPEGASGPETTESQVESPIMTDPAIEPAKSHQNPTKSTKDGIATRETEIYVAQAWTNRGPYGAEPECRARGRVNILRPPWTGLSVLLKEEKTRTRERADKEEKSIRKRLGKNMWTQLPDRPVTKQSQYVLW